MPMRVIGMLLGIPEADQEALRDGIDESLRLEEGQPARRARSDDGPIDQRRLRRIHRVAAQASVRRPDDGAAERRLRRRHRRGAPLRDDELLSLIGLLAGAGNETTTRLIGWTGFLLDRFPDQRRLLAADRSLVPNAIEEILRFEAPSPVQARYVMRDVVHHGTRVPQGSVLLLLNGSANRDERRFENPDQLDVRRKIVHHLSFGYGIHFCLGAASRGSRDASRWKRSWSDGRIGRSTTTGP